VFEEHPDCYFVTPTSTGQLWFDGYDGQDVVIFDDFYGGLPLPYMLRLLDGYPMRLPIKGGHTYAKWTKVYLTSNVPPTEWYQDPDGAFARRIHEVVEFLAEDPDAMDE